VTRDQRFRPSTELGSEGATIAFLAGHVVRFELEPGGRLARRPAAGEQVLVVVCGEGDGSTVDVREGDVVRWAPGEDHETVARAALTAIVVE
jgi:quercetin dioxygenase-like cupin family protein